MRKENKMQYIRKQIKRLKLEESVDLEFVFPELIEVVLGDFIF